MEFSKKILSLYLSQEILIFSKKGQLLEKDGTCFFGVGFCLFLLVACGGDVIFHIFKLKKELSVYEEKIGLSEKESLLAAFIPCLLLTLIYSD